MLMLPIVHRRMLATQQRISYAEGYLSMQTGDTAKGVVNDDQSTTRAGLALFWAGLQLLLSKQCSPLSTVFFLPRFLAGIVSDRRDVPDCASDSR